MNSGSENKKDRSNTSELEATRSFLDNLPQANKPEPKKSTLDDHLAFLNSLPKAAPKPAVEPVAEMDPVESYEAVPAPPVSLEGVREADLDVHEGTESPNMGPQETVVPKPVAPVSEDQLVDLDDVEVDEHVITAAEAAMNA
jgi:hypothetical protein